MQKKKVQSKTVQAFIAAIAAIAMTFVSLPAQAAAPTLAATPFAPTFGAPGIEVTITGTNFDSPNVSSVRFGTVSATFTIESATSIKATVPSGAGQVTVSVQNADGTATTSALFTYAPTITSVTPNSGPEGGTNTVVITGTNFFGVSGVAAVKFGPNNATSYKVDSATQITAVVPANGTGPEDVIVVATGGTATLTSGYVYVKSPPTISSIGTTSGPLTGGTTVVITGTNFFGVSGVAAVKFGTKNASSYTVNSPTQITAITPSGAAGTVSIVVTAVDGTATLAAAYTYRVSSTAVSASEKIFFVPGRSEIRSSQYPAFSNIALAIEGKSGVRITITSRRWSGAPASLGKARNVSVVKLLKLLGIDGQDVFYTRFNTKRAAGGATADKNNRVTVSVSWTN
jgi:hypothetical protein